MHAEVLPTCFPKRMFVYKTVDIAKGDFLHRKKAYTIIIVGNAISSGIVQDFGVTFHIIESLLPYAFC